MRICIVGAGDARSSGESARSWGGGAGVKSRVESRAGAPPGEQHSRRSMRLLAR